MKVLFLADYHPPFNPGGSEWSTHYLANSLKDNGIKTLVLTPNYGADPREIIKGVEVARFSTPFKLNNQRSVIKPVFQNNPLFFIWSAISICWSIVKLRPNILQVNGKYLIPGAFIASRLSRRPLIVSIRDKQLLCSYGKCFFAKNRYKRCSWHEYLTLDLFWFYKNYVLKKSLLTFVYTFLSAIWTRVMNDIIAGFAKRADVVIAISKSQKKYLEENGFKGVEVIYNSMEFDKNQKTGRRSGVLFAGKLSLGKGIYELLGAIPEVLNTHKETFFFAGGIDNKRKIEEIVKKEKIDKSVKFLGGVDHFKLQELYKKVKLVVMPSVFPEAFGRVALEALAVGTPVVVSDVGGLPEIVSNKVTGVITNVDSSSLASAIKEVLSNNHSYLENVKKRRRSLIRRFEIEPINQHIELYRRLL